MLRIHVFTGPGLERIKSQGLRGGVAGERRLEGKENSSASCQSLCTSAVGVGGFFFFFDLNNPLQGL